MIFDGRRYGEQILSYEGAKARCRKINERANLMTLRSLVENNYLNNEGNVSHCPQIRKKWFLKVKNGVEYQSNFESVTKFFCIS